MTDAEAAIAIASEGLRALAGGGRLALLEVLHRPRLPAGTLLVSWGRIASLPCIPGEHLLSGLPASRSREHAVALINAGITGGEHGVNHCVLAAYPELSRDTDTLRELLVILAEQALSTIGPAALDHVQAIAGAHFAALGEDVDSFGGLAGNAALVVSDLVTGREAEARDHLASICASSTTAAQCLLGIWIALISFLVDQPEGPPVPRATLVTTDGIVTSDPRNREERLGLIARTVILAAVDGDLTAAALPLPGLPETDQAAVAWYLATAIAGLGRA